MKLAFAVVVAVLAMGAAAQDYYYGVPPAPSMAAQQVGQGMAVPGAGFVDERGVPVPAAPSMDALYPPQQPFAFVEQAQAQAQAQAQPQMAQVQGAAPYFNTEEADTEEETTEEEASEEEEGAVEETEESAEGDDARFMQQRGWGKKLKNALKKAKKAASKVAKKAAKKAKKVAAKLKKLGKKGARALKKLGKKLVGAAKKKGKKFFKPKSGKPNNSARSPSAKTPKAAGGRKLPPMPAPLAKAFKISCKLNPALCITAETPAEGDEPGDHSPKAVFKKKMEVIKKSLMSNNRNIAQESKWIDQVELIMKQYALKVKKVKEHIADERKAIKELLRQRRIIINEKKQKELELKLKMATTELTSLTDALQQVQKKEKELGHGKTTLATQIKTLSTGLKQLRTSNEEDKKAALKKSD